MKCYRCGEELNNSDVCVNCGSDVSAYKIVARTSNSYYNQGLIKAQIRDLTGAEYCLRTSLSINKYNTKARNLLGLVYYEMGEVVQALSEWVISKHYKPDKNAADVFIKKVQSNQNKLEAMNQTIKKFNRCLVYAQEGSDDVAKIQLKKVISTNPKLLKAHLLLALLYMKKGEYERGKKWLNKVLQIDKGNTLAQAYIKEANERIAASKRMVEVDYTKPVAVKSEKENERKALTGHDVIVPKGSYKEPSNGAITIINILMGVAIGAALIWFLILPTKIKGVTTTNNKQVKEYVEKLAQANADITRLESELKTLTEHRDELQEGSDTSNEVLEQYTKILEGWNNYNSGNYVAAVESIMGIDSTTLASSGARNLYNIIWSNSFIIAYDTLIKEGEGYVSAKDNVNAATAYARAYAINPTEVSAYNAGLNYQASGDAESAKTYYNYVVNNYPSSKYAADCTKRLAALQ